MLSLGLPTPLTNKLKSSSDIGVPDPAVTNSGIMLEPAKSIESTNIPTLLYTFALFEGKQYSGISARVESVIAEVYSEKLSLIEDEVGREIPPKTD